eukprot:CAMPEP_0196238286 /NCGR_PEP_ID=MMETSP0913-20130531/7004_1 /TAXON_ID=49265 /ORGANISM="Thalassiosira rotula, Strain GSO102" /LENGTH=115 /DNA_ID=CAMNT_0041519981 /DNA_START=392 /DNA_END=736 /DNA_ORIENTATION=+
MPISLGTSIPSLANRAIVRPFSDTVGTPSPIFQSIKRCTTSRKASSASSDESSAFEAADAAAVISSRFLIRYNATSLDGVSPNHGRDSLAYSFHNASPLGLRFIHHPNRSGTGGN